MRDVRRGRVPRKRHHARQGVVSRSSWLQLGREDQRPRAPAAVVVFEREGGGHVGFAVAQDQRGRLLVLGGNQGNKVSIAPFEKFRVLGYRWPADHFADLTAAGALPVVKDSGASSGNEA